MRKRYVDSGKGEGEEIVREADGEEINEKR